MKILFHFTALIAILFTAACSKETVNREGLLTRQATIVKDCTGTYLRMNEKDYQVCNLEAASSIPNGTKVTATFRYLAQCKGSAADAIVCMMYHENEGWIEVAELNR